ncbi:hypothetical protein ABW21_db0208167 [Orbilia brochopaga]|nr:hypothetical protein ABW21_db0208167 [Drechslerella brochopaga]
MIFSSRRCLGFFVSRFLIGFVVNVAGGRGTGLRDGFAAEFAAGFHDPVHLLDHVLHVFRAEPVHNLDEIVALLGDRVRVLRRHALGHLSAELDHHPSGVLHPPHGADYAFEGFVLRDLPREIVDHPLGFLNVLPDGLVVVQDFTQPRLATGGFGGAGDGVGDGTAGFLRQSPQPLLRPLTPPRRTLHGEIPSVLLQSARHRLRPPSLLVPVRSQRVAVDIIDLLMQRLDPSKHFRVRDCGREGRRQRLGAVNDVLRLRGLHHVVFHACDEILDEVFLQRIVRPEHLEDIFAFNVPVTIQIIRAESPPVFFRHVGGCRQRPLRLDR